MEITKEIQEERERIKEKVNSVINGMIEHRKRKIKSVKRRNLSMLERIKDRIIFHIDNPNYVRISEHSNNS